MKGIVAILSTTIVAVLVLAFLWAYQTNEENNRRECYDLKRSFPTAEFIYTDACYHQIGKDAYRKRGDPKTYSKKDVFGS